jgi:hypothetical protein
MTTAIVKIVFVTRNAQLAPAKVSHIDSIIIKGRKYPFELDPQGLVEKVIEPKAS